MNEKYQKMTSSHHGRSVRVTLSQDDAILTALLDHHPIESIVMTHSQAQEIVQLLQEGLKESVPTEVCSICQRHDTKLFNLLPGALGNRAPIRVCANCYDIETDVEAHELHRG